MMDPSEEERSETAAVTRRGDRPLAEFLADLVTRNEVSAAAALVSAARGPARWATAGSSRGGGALTRNSLFDLASLTKPLMGTLALVLDAEGRVPLGMKVGEIFPRAVPALASESLSALLHHTAGFKPWAPLYALAYDRATVLDLLVSGRTLGGASRCYSDLDFILWALAVEQLSGRSVDDLLGEYVLSRLDEAAMEISRRPDAARVVTCVLDGAKEKELAIEQGIKIEPPRAPARGEAQDGNARFLQSLGIASAHAGLFGSLDAVLALCREWLEPSRLLTVGSVSKALRGRGPFALGWMRRRVRGAAGGALTPHAFGHTGFTGGSLWIDPGKGSIHVLLAHRTSPGVDMNAVRRRFHRDFVFETS